MKKLHIGSGRVYLPGWTNVDLFSTSKADLFCDMMRLPFEPKTFDVIYACHVLEHTHRSTVYAVLHHWRELLVPGGLLRLSVPNFGAIVQEYCQGCDLPQLMGLLYGRQDHPLNSHSVAFDKKTLMDALRKAGFDSEIREWDWRKTEHSEFDDFSQAYLPHLHKEDGRHMSLNMEALRHS